MNASMRKQILASSLMQNEQQKAQQAVGAYRVGSDFGGTSISALVRVPELNNSIAPKNYVELADIIADSYIAETSKMSKKLKRAFTRKEVDIFKEHGLFFGLHISPKLLGITEGLTVNHREINLEGFPD
ncbi:MAG: hypothetical protein AABX35_00790, partial [Nanoarchaeota archaeon]